MSRYSIGSGRALGIVTVTAIAVIAGPSRPYAYNAYGWNWATGQAEYYVNPANADVSPDAALAAIKSGAAAWTAQTQAPFSFYYMGYTSGNTVQNNGKNEVFFRGDTNGTAIATTYYWYSGSQALDADIVLWDGAYKFFTGSSGCSGGFYIEDVATHEFGHALGLGHSSVSDATMVSGTTYCGTYKRTLAADDIAGAEAVYTNASTAAAAPPPVTLTASMASARRTVRVGLSWTATTWASTALYRNSAVIATLSGVTSYADSLSAKASGTYTYQVCDTAGSGCSNAAAISY